MSFLMGITKIAVMDLADEARITALAPFQDAVPGSSLSKSTAQAKGRATRTEGVQNEEKEFKKNLRHDWTNTRVPTKSGLRE